MVLWHPRTSWGLRNRIFSKKSGQKAPKTRLPPPLVSELRDIKKHRDPKKENDDHKENKDEWECEESELSEDETI